MNDLPSDKVMLSSCMRCTQELHPTFESKLVPIWGDLGPKQAQVDFNWLIHSCFTTLGPKFTKPGPSLNKTQIQGPRKTLNYLAHDTRPKEVERLSTVMKLVDP